MRCHTFGIHFFVKIGNFGVPYFYQYLTDFWKTSHLYFDKLINGGIFYLNEKYETLLILRDIVKKSILFSILGWKGHCPVYAKTSQAYLVINRQRGKTGQMFTLTHCSVTPTRHHSTAFRWPATTQVLRPERIQGRSRFKLCFQYRNSFLFLQSIYLLFRIQQLQQESN